MKQAGEMRGNGKNPLGDHSRIGRWGVRSRAQWGARALLIGGVSLLGCGAPSWGFYLDESKVVTLKIGRQGLTRLSVKDDKIQDVFVHPAEAADALQLHKSGHIFMTPEGLTGPLSLTIMTESGKTQDLKVTATDRDSGPIYLEERRPLPPPVSLLESRRPPEDVLADFVFKGTSAGFHLVPVSPSTRQVQGISFALTRVWSGAHYQVHEYRGRAPELQDDRAFSLSLDQARRVGDVILSETSPSSTLSKKSPSDTKDLSFLVIKHLNISPLNLIEGKN